ncbi:glycosyltransferase [Schleiferiaceae bacterium]|nr:glycosyltransferase [Schleiferiaceae bacterium]
MRSTQSKVLVLLPSLYKGGAEKIGITLFEEIQSRGYDVILVSLDRNDKYSYKVAGEITYIESDNFFLKILEFVKILHGFNISTIYSASQKTNIFSGLACLLMPKIHIVFREPNTAENFHYSYPSLIKKYIIKLSIQISYRRANTIIANSQDTKEDLIKENFASSGKIDIIENPIELKSTVIDLDPVDSPTIKVILIGRLEYQKNIPLAVDICAVLNTHIPTELTVVGSGSLESEIRDLSKSLNYDISIIDSVDDVDNILRNKTFLLHTSRWEGYGNVLIESLRNALPVVSTCTKGGSKDILKKYSNSGLLIDCQDSQKIAEIIFENLNYLRRSRVELVKSFRNEYDYNRIIAEYLKYIK